MKNKIYFDLDGVLRSLADGIGGMKLKTWDDLAPNGQTFCGYIDDRLEVLLEAPRTKYFDVITGNGPIDIVTYQAPYWRPNTVEWVARNIPGKYTLTFVDSMEGKLKYLERGFLVEDYPKFPREAYDRIVLIDYPYNRGIDALARVKRPWELETILQVLRQSHIVCR